MGRFGTDLAMARPRYGYRWLHVLLRREGWKDGHDRVYRIYREENLIVRTKRRRRLAAQTRAQPAMPQAPRERWAIDFVSDGLSDGRKFRVLTVVDVFSRTCDNGTEFTARVFDAWAHHRGIRIDAAEHLAVAQERQAAEHLLLDDIRARPER